MARPQKIKRPDGLSPAKKHKSSNHPPDFWDNLSKAWLMRRALGELDRRNSTSLLPEPTTAANNSCDNLARFPRHGGPDVRGLRFGTNLVHLLIHISLVSRASKTPT